MRTSVIYGVILAVCVAVWMLICGYTGWYKHPVGAFAFTLVIPINIVVIILGLMKTKKEGRRYGGQVAAGLVMGIVAAVLIFFNSLLYTQVLFPSYFDDIRTAQQRMLLKSGMEREQIEEQLEAASAMQTPAIQATLGAIGTIGTSLVTALVAAAFIRKKD